MKKIFSKKLLYGLLVIFIFLIGNGCARDNEAPTITPISQTIEYNTELKFSELVSVEDNHSEEIEISILSSEIPGIVVEEEKQTITFETPGNYEIEVSATDEAGNSSTEIVLVEVVDKTVPVIDCSQEGFSLAETAEKGVYSTEITAYDEVNGDLTDKIEVDDSQVKYGTVGTYEIQANVSDSSGNICTRIFYVTIEDTTAPVLSLTKTSFFLTEGDNAPDYRKIATATDGVDGDITEQIIIDDSKVDYDSAGTYKVVYTVTDDSGNVSTQEVTVKVQKKVETKSSSSSGTGTSGVQVLITRTGECYHVRKCGNGTYFWVSLSEAKSRGLRPCQKCY